MTTQTSRLIALTLTAIVSAVAFTQSSRADGLRQPMVQTPMTQVELLSALRDGHVEVFGQLPGHNRLAMGWAQVALENGHGNLTFNHNLGNVVATRRDQPTYRNKGDGGVYRAFDTFTDGAAAYWGTLKHCAVALHQFDAGFPVDATKSLKRCKYFEADVDQYSRAVSSLYYYAQRHLFVEEIHEQRQQQFQCGITATTGTTFDTDTRCDQLVSWRLWISE